MNETSLEAANFSSCKIFDDVNIIEYKLNLKKYCIDVMTALFINSYAFFIQHGEAEVKNIYAASRFCTWKGEVSNRNESLECFQQYRFAIAMCNSHYRFYDSRLYRKCVDTINSHNITIDNYENMCQYPAVQKTKPCIYDRKMRADLFNITMYFTTDYELSFYSYVFPFLAAIIIACNIMMIVTFIFGRHLSAAHVLLMGISMFDILMILVITPFLFYYLTLGNYIYVVPYEMCITALAVMQCISPIFHGVSIWLSLGFTLQRYTWYVNPMLASSAFSARRYSFVYIGVVLITVSLMFLPTIISLKNYTAVKLVSSAQGAMTSTFKTPVDESSNGQVSSTLVLRGLFLHIIPCLIVVFLGFQAVAKTKKGKIQSITDELEKADMPSLNSKNRQRFQSITMILVVIFLLTKFPGAVVTTAVYIMQNVAVAENTTVSSINGLIFVTNILVMLSGAGNFIIFCIFGTQFRSLLLRIITCGIKFNDKNANEVTTNETVVKDVAQ